MSKASRQREQAHYAAEQVNLERAEAAIRDQRRWKRERRNAPANSRKQGGRISPGDVIVNPEFVKTGRIEKSFPSNKHLILRSTDSKGFSNDDSWRCYWNSMLQVLMHAPPVYHLLGNLHRDCENGVSQCVVCALQQLAQEYWNGGGDEESLTTEIHSAVVSRLPRSHVGLGDYHDNSQNDSAVYLSFILGELERVSISTQRASVEKVFYLHSQQHMDCVECGERKEWTMNTSRLGFSFSLRGPGQPVEDEEWQGWKYFEEELEEEVEEEGLQQDVEEVEQDREEVEEEEKGEQDGGEDEQQGREQESAHEESVEEYIRTCELEEQGPFTCESASCQLRQQHPDYERPTQTRHTLLHYCPDVLIIQINRFGSSEGEKIITDSDFPEEIYLGRYTPTPSVPVWYRFSGLVAHQGAGVDAGHYISVVRNPDQSFRIINDDDVQTTSNFHQDVKLPGPSDDDRYQPSVLCYTKC